MSADKIDPERIEAVSNNELTDQRTSRAKFEQLFRKHNDSLLAFINAKLNSRTESRDVVQEAYVKLLRLEESKEVSHLQAYLYRIANNLAIDRLRQREVHARRQHLVLFEAAERDNPCPERWWIAQQERELLERAVTELPPRCRMAFTLVELEEQPVQAVAEHMGLRPKVVLEFVQRAYGYLARAMVDQDGG